MIKPMWHKEKRQKSEGPKEPMGHHQDHEHTHCESWKRKIIWRNNCWNFPHLRKYMSINFQEALYSKMNWKKPTLRHIIIKLSTGSQR